MPKLIINRAYKKQINDKVEREIIKEEAQQKLIKEQKETTKEEIAIKKEQVKLAEENRKLEDKTSEKIWEKEYEEFIKAANRKTALSQLISTIYVSNGTIWNNIISGENLMLCDVNGLANVNEDKCSITDKGKYFLRRFSSEKD